MQAKLIDHIIAIDPGTRNSAFVRWNGRRVLAHNIVPNLRLRDMSTEGAEVVIEMVEGRGRVAGQETFDTCVWIGRFMERFDTRNLVYRRIVKLHMCGNVRAKDSQIRQAILDRFPKGTARAPGPTYGVSRDCWQALAVAITWWDQMVNNKEEL